MKKLPTAADLGALPGIPSAPVTRVPSLPATDLSAAGSVGKAISGLGSVFAGVGEAQEREALIAADHVVETNLVEFNRNQQRALQDARRDMQPGGEGFADTWSQGYGTQARESFKTTREALEGMGLSPRVMQRALTKYDLGITRSHEALQSHAYNQIQLPERDRFKKERTNNFLEGLFGDVRGNPDALTRAEEDGLRHIETSPLNPADKYSVRQTFRRKLGDEWLAGLVAGVIDTETANRARQRLYGDLAPGPPERRDRSGSDFGPIAPRGTPPAVRPPGGQPPLQEERAVGGEPRAEPPPGPQSSLSNDPRAQRVFQAAAATAGKGPSAMTVAREYLGASERDNPEALAAFFRRSGGQNLDPRSLAWCMAFVNAALGGSGARGTGTLMARDALRIGTAANEPERGDIVVLSRGDPRGPYGHVGFYDGRNSDGSIRVLGGNQGGDGRVSIESFPADRVLGYRRPPRTGTPVPEFNIAETPAGDRPGAPRVAQAATSGSDVFTGSSAPRPPSGPSLPTDRPVGAGGPAGAFATPGDQAEYARQMAGEIAAWPRGLVAPGTIDSVIRNPDRSTSAVPSYSIPATINGEQRQVLVPAFTPEGRRLTQAQAHEQFQATDRHIGIFDTDENARAFASAEAQQAQLPGPMRVGGRLWADAMERAEGEGAYVRPPATLDRVSTSRINATRRAIDAKERQLIAPLEQEMARWETLARDGKLPPEANVAQILERVEAIDEPQLTQQFRSVMELAAFTRQFRTLPPSQMDRLIDMEERRQMAEGASDIADKRLKHMVALRNAARTAITTDQNGWANTVGVVPSSGFDGSPASFANDGVMREHLERSRAAAQWLSAQGAPRQPQFFSPDQKQAAQGIARQGGDAMLGMLGSIVRNWGGDAPRAIAEFAKDDPELAFIGGMYLDVARANGAGMQAVKDAAQGVALRSDENVKKATGRDLPSEAELRDAAGGMLGDTFQLSRGTRDAAIATANLIYLARQKSLTTFDQTLWRQALKEALGEHTVGTTTYGGIYHQRRGLFGGDAGKQIQVPPNIRQDGVRNLVDSLRIEDLIDPFGEGPRTQNGNIVSMDVIRDSTLVSAGNGQYWLAQGDPAGSRPQWIKNSDGKPYVLDLNKLEPILRQRRPEEYLGHEERPDLVSRQQRVIDAYTPRDQRRAPDITRTLPEARALSPAILYEFRRQFVQQNPDPARRRAIESDRERYGQELQRFIERTPGLRDSSSDRYIDALPPSQQAAPAPQPQSSTAGPPERHGNLGKGPAPEPAPPLFGPGDRESAYVEDRRPRMKESDNELLRMYNEIGAKPRTPENLKKLQDMLLEMERRNLVVLDRPETVD